MAKTETSLQDRDLLRKTVVLVPEVVDNTPPQKWWPKLARSVFKMERALADFQNPELRQYVAQNINLAKDVLRKTEKINTTDPDTIASVFEHEIMERSMSIAAPFEPKKKVLETHFIPLTRLFSDYPDDFRGEEKILNGVPIIEVSISHPVKKSEWDSKIPLPISCEVHHKGGPAREAFNRVAKAPLSMQLSEYPRNDYDAITTGNPQENYDVAIAIGVDPAGVEYHGRKLDFKVFGLGRDTDQNQVLLDAKGIYYSRPAEIAAKTGHIALVGEYMANKAIYGIDRVFIHDLLLAKPRGLMRLVKSLSEGKALSFDYLPVNSNFDMGIYSLFLARKWEEKEQYPQLLSRMYHVMRQMNQVRPGEDSIDDVLERAHCEYPFFNFDREIKNIVELTRWKTRKFAKEFVMIAGWLYPFSPTLNLKRTPNDTVPVRINMENFIYDEKRGEKLRSWWPNFQDRARRRTAEFNKLGISYSNQVFFADQDLDDFVFCE
jgi:hypothetical protein